jgi:hypothetical protein
MSALAAIGTELHQSLFLSMSCLTTKHEARGFSRPQSPSTARTTRLSLTDNNDAAVMSARIQTLNMRVPVASFKRLRLDFPFFFVFLSNPKSGRPKYRVQHCSQQLDSDAPDWKATMLHLPQNFQWLPPGNLQPTHGTRTRS